MRLGKDKKRTVYNYPEREPREGYQWRFRFAPEEGWFEVSKKWRIVAISNFCLDTFDEYFYDDNLYLREEADAIIEELNSNLSPEDRVSWTRKPEDYKLYVWEP